jgi:hypothetical protein
MLEVEHPAALYLIRRTLYLIGKTLNLNHTLMNTCP